ncbi:hypothetical protein [Sphingomonas sp.]|uniref:hypothetical protein n=1 Tax=Sphingomonas sp. TaxID=28214 RepID=UPI003B00F61E
MPGYGQVNLNVPYDPLAGFGWWSRLSFVASVENLTNRTCIGSASIIADSLAANGSLNPALALRNVTGLLYAGQPRTVIVGIKGCF